MDSEHTANVLQVWRLSDLKLLHTLAMPEIAGDSAHKYPFEVRAMADGRSVLVNSYYCGFFRLTDVGGNPHVDRVMSMPLPRNMGCSVPVIAGKFMVMPIAYAHRYATIDISDPRIRERSRHSPLTRRSSPTGRRRIRGATGWCLRIRATVPQR